MIPIRFALIIPSLLSYIHTANGAGKNCLPTHAVIVNIPTQTTGYISLYLLFVVIIKDIAALRAELRRMCRIFRLPAALITLI